jgi:hypothetical protein
MEKGGDYERKSFECGGYYEREFLTGYSKV